jgi:hypothetical protein
MAIHPRIMQRTSAANPAATSSLSSGMKQHYVSGYRIVVWIRVEMWLEMPDEGCHSPVLVGSNAQLCPVARRCQTSSGCEFPFNTIFAGQLKALRNRDHANNQSRTAQPGAGNSHHSPTDPRVKTATVPPMGMLPIPAPAKPVDSISQQAAASSDTESRMWVRWASA